MIRDKCLREIGFVARSRITSLCVSFRREHRLMATMEKDSAASKTTSITSL